MFFVAIKKQENEKSGKCFLRKSRELSLHACISTYSFSPSVNIRENCNVKNEKKNRFDYLAK